MIYFLQYYGGVHKNCLNYILHSTNDETNESDSLPIMKTSSYYDTDHFKSLVNTKINSFGISHPIRRLLVFPWVKIVVPRKA